MRKQKDILNAVMVSNKFNKWSISMTQKQIKKKLMKIFQQVTSISKIDTDLNISNDLYIDSITWVRLLSSIENEFEIKNNFYDFFEESLSIQTLAELADLIERYI